MAGLRRRPNTVYDEATRSIETAVSGSHLELTSAAPLLSSAQFNVGSARERCARMRGTLTRFNEHNGIGAITSEGGIELWVHKNSMEPSGRPLKEGQTVEFRIYYGPYGPIAENVQRSYD